MTRPALIQVKNFLSNFHRQFITLNNNVAKNNEKELCKIVSNTNSTNTRSNQTSSVCWKCGIERKNLSKLFCEECSYIQNPYQTKNYFKVMDMEEKFDLDNKLLRQKYKSMQTLLHPDKFSNKTSEEKVISENFSALVNKAYNDLQIPLKRAEHLLQLKGYDISENSTVDDPEFLMEIMSLNEEVDNANDEKSIRELDLKNRNEIDKLVKEIDTKFEKDDIENARVAIIKLKYYTSLSKRINTIMRDLGIVD